MAETRDLLGLSGCQPRYFKLSKAVSISLLLTPSFIFETRKVVSLNHFSFIILSPSIAKFSSTISLLEIKSTYIHYHSAASPLTVNNSDTKIPNELKYLLTITMLRKYFPKGSTLICLIESVLLSSHFFPSLPQCLMQNKYRKLPTSCCTDVLFQV